MFHYILFDLIPIVYNGSHFEQVKETFTQYLAAEASCFGCCGKLGQDGVSNLDSFDIVKQHHEQNQKPLKGKWLVEDKLWRDMCNWKTINNTWIPPHLLSPNHWKKSWAESTTTSMKWWQVLPFVSASHLPGVGGLPHNGDDLRVEGGFLGGGKTRSDRILEGRER